MNGHLASAHRTPGFARLPIGSSRRQLRLSLSTVALLTVGIISAATTFAAHPLSALRDVAVRQAVTTLHADTNVIGAVRS